MGVKRGLQFSADPARVIGNALHLGSFNAPYSDPGVFFNGLRETARGSLILFDQPMLFLAVHRAISYGHAEQRTSSGLPQV
jgi:hypothetical protein